MFETRSHLDLSCEARRDDVDWGPGVKDSHHLNLMDGYFHSSDQRVEYRDFL